MPGTRVPWVVAVQASTWHSRKSAYSSMNCAVAWSPRSRAKHAAHSKAAILTAMVEGEYPEASSHLSWAVAGPCRMRFLAAPITMEYGSNPASAQYWCIRHARTIGYAISSRSEEHTSELQSQFHLV